MANLYERLSMLCEERGIKGAQMCRELGISKSLMTDLKSGRKKGVNAETAQKLANYFDVSVGYLLGEEGKKEKPTVQDDGLSEKQKAFIKKVMQMSDDELDRLDQILSLVENTK